MGQSILGSDSFSIVDGDWVRLRQVIQKLAHLVVGSIRTDMADALSGLQLDFDIPLMEGITFTVSGSAPQWTAGTIQYGGTVYTIASGSGSTSTRGIYWEPADTTLTAQNTPTSAQDRWFMAFFDGTTVTAALQNSIIHAGLLQANTITATQIAANAVKASEADIDNIMTQSVTVGGSIHSSAKTSYGDSDQGWWIGIDGGTAKLNIGDANRYMKWTGTTLDLVTDKGKVGSSVNFFDISNGVLEVSIAGAFTEVKGGAISMSSATGASGDLDAYWFSSRLIVYQVNSGDDAYLNVKNSNSHNCFFARAHSTGTQFIVSLLDGTKYIDLNENAGTKSLANWTLTSCSIAASQIDSGTLPDARFPTDAIGYASGGYGGSASAQNISCGSGNAAIHVLIKRKENTTGAMVGVFDGTNMFCWPPHVNNNPTTDTPISQHANGFTVAGGDANVNAATKNYIWVAYYALN